MAWGTHTAVALLLVRAMGLPTSLPWVELLCYTGYAFVPASLTLVVGVGAGQLGLRVLKTLKP